MADHVANRIKYIVRINQAYEQTLGALRCWPEIKVAFEGEYIWLTGFDEHQIKQADLVSIPSLERFYAQEGELYLIGNTLPQCVEPMLLWTPIQRAIQVELPSYNHHYFGVEEKISIALEQSAENKKAFAQLVDIGVLSQYVESAPEIRLSSLKWTLINQDTCLVLGQPTLPLPGETFWLDQPFLLPMGKKLNVSFLKQQLLQKLGVHHSDVVLWWPNNEYSLIEFNQIEKLSLSSVRLTLKREKNS